MIGTQPSTRGAAPLPLLVVAVALGGALGALARWAAVGLTPDERGFPTTTFAINVSGSLLLALAPAALVLVASHRTHSLLAEFVGPGLLGGWTTLSAYAEQARDLLARGEAPTAAAYVAGTLAACLLAVALGSWLAGRLSPSASAAPEDGVDE